MVRWPGTVKPGTIINDIFSAEDWVPTLAAAAGIPDIKDKLLQGYNGFKVHLDGYDADRPARRQRPVQAPRVFLLDRRR
jgi:arylsulfatase A-like enzyme